MLDRMLLDLGVSSAKAVVLLWTSNPVAGELSGAVLEALSDKGLDLLDRRRAARQFDQMADRIAQNLSPMVASEFGGIPENEIASAVLAVSRVLDAVQIRTPQTLIELDFEPLALERLLLAQPEARQASELGDDGTAVFHRIIRECCNYIIEVVLALPSFVSQTLVEMLRRQSDISDRVDLVLQRLPRPEAEVPSADAEYDLQYRRHIARVLDTVELFGLTLSDESRRYDLSVSYITLSASTDDAVSEEGAFPVDLEEVEPKVTNPRVDQVLASGSRHLIRGEAGSGKTTLLQWLAVSLARGEIDPSLATWLNKTPFFLQLRRYAHGSLPSPEEFLDNTAKPIAGAMPQGWVHRRLMGGNAVVLIDGVDELPEAQRSDARDWLSQMLTAFPDTVFVITTRPPAVPTDWLADGSFAVSELLPMSLSDTVRFVQHWYNAARAGLSVNQSNEADALDAYERSLLRVLEDVPQIRSLATTPLLCAMLCALNRDRRTQLPRDRMDLYRIALESLLDRREVERGISDAVSEAVPVRERMALLEDLAYWMLQNGLSDAVITQAEARVALRLEYMPAVRPSATTVLRFLIGRSGLLREPVEGRVDFIHRTFQEYLGAARAVSEQSIPFLIANAHDDQWREVIVLAAGHASVHERDALLHGLLNRGHEEPSYRHRLHLLAAACLETAVEVSPQTAESVRSSLRDALPPTNMTEARAVASAGTLAAPLLEQYVGGLATTAAACVRALCLIGGDESLAVLRSYGRDRRVTVSRELIRGWDYFDRTRYANEVLAESPLDYGSLTVSDLRSLEAVSALRNLRHLQYAPAREVSSLVEVPNLDLVTQLDLSAATGITSLEGIDGAASLLRLECGPWIADSELASLPPSLTVLRLEGCSQLRDMSSLAALENLEEFSARRIAAQSLEGLSELPLVEVRLAELPNVKDFAFVRRLSRLRRFSYRDMGVSVEGSSWSAIRDLSVFSGADITELDLQFSGPLGAITLDGAPSTLNTLNLSGLVAVRDASRLSAAAALTSLRLSGARNLADWSFLDQLANLTSVSLTHGSFGDIQHLASSSRTLRTLELSGSEIETLQGLEHLPRLRFLDLRGCPLKSLTGLKLATPGIRVFLDESKRSLIDAALTERHHMIFMRWMNRG